MAGAEKSIYSSLYERPLLNMSGFAAKHGLRGELYAYLNYGGATGSGKDALAEGMLALAAERGDLITGQPVIEASSGTFAVALTIAALHSGHPVYLIIPGSVSSSRQEYLKNLGAEVIVTNYVYGMTGTMNKAKEVAQQVKGYFVNYFSNDDNPEFHRRVTGPAIFKAMNGEIDNYIAGVGSGGTLSGTAEYLKAWAGNVWTVAVQPYESQNLSGGFTGKHGINGIGAGFVPDNYNPYIVDEIISVSTGEAKSSAFEALFTDAVPASPSCGAVLSAAKDVMQKRGGKTVCVFNGMVMYE